jgi:transcriptional regulatory protein LevR
MSEMKSEHWTELLNYAKYYNYEIIMEKYPEAYVLCYSQIRQISHDYDLEIEQKINKIFD